MEHALRGHMVAHVAAHFGHVGDALGNNVARALQLRRLGRHLLAVPDTLGERLQPRFARDIGTGAAPRLVRLVKVFERRLLIATLDLAPQFRRQLALAGDRLQNRRLALFEFGIVAEALLDLEDSHFIEIAVRLFAVARDKRHRATFAQQFGHGRNLVGTGAHLARHTLDDGVDHGRVSLLGNLMT